MTDLDFEKLLLSLDTDTARYMLADLRDPNKRSPQLYNSILKMLDRYKFKVGAYEPEESVLSQLASELPPAITEEDHYAH